MLIRTPAGYLNHSCAPNVYVYSVDRRRFILAMRDIASGEDLLFDYSINGVDGDVWVRNCGARDCRGRHRRDFFDLPYLDPWFADVSAERLLDLLA